MYDERLNVLANQLVRYSVNLQKGEHLLISCTNQELPLVKLLIKAAYEVGGYPHIDMHNEQLDREIMLGSSEGLLEAMSVYRKSLMDCMDAAIYVSTPQNPMEMTTIPSAIKDMWNKARSKWNDKQREGKVKWSVCIYPTPFYANMAGMSLEEFENYYFSVCCMDYVRFGKSMSKLKQIMDNTDKVRIVSPGTDLSFSVKGIDKAVSAGDRNVPDGEVYTAPVKESVNGQIAFNVKSVYQGHIFNDIKLTFKDGRVIKATGTPQKQLDEILDIDEGAKYIGEFAYGLNPQLKTPIGSTLFDEKINGSIHLALGCALDLTDNGNRSAIHWDIVLLQTKEAGGGEIYLDDRLIRKDGKFVIPELEELNGTF